MTTPDDAIATLRRARPQLPVGVASPTSEAAQALLEEILSMPTTPTIEIDRPGPSDPSAARPRSRRPLVLAAAAAVALAGAAAVVVTGAGSGSGGDHESVEVGPAAGDRQPAGSGRLRTSWDLQWDMVPAGARMPTTYSWSGDDFEMVSDATQVRSVDGRAWSYMPVLAHVPPGGTPVEELPHAWYETEHHRPGILEVDPATLLDQLAVTGPFEPVGEEDVEGVPTQRRRAANPSSTALAVLAATHYFQLEATVTGLEVWVDDDDLVRRVDIVSTGVARGEDFTETVSYVWYDLGAAITIEPPADVAEGEDPSSTGSEPDPEALADEAAEDEAVEDEAVAHAEELAEAVAAAEAALAEAQRQLETASAEAEAAAQARVDEAVAALAEAEAARAEAQAAADAAEVESEAESGG